MPARNNIRKQSAKPSHFYKFLSDTIPPNASKEYIDGYNAGRKYKQLLTSANKKNNLTTKNDTVLFGLTAEKKRAIELEQQEKQR